MSKMGNSITASVEFSFKGEVFSPSAVIDLDRAVSQQGLMSSIHRIIARENEIDTYSYLYEVMEQAEIVFDDAQGTAADYLSDGVFDFSGFQAGLYEAKLDQLCREIVRTEMKVDDLNQIFGLKRALRKAYELGKKKTAE
jgi:hypothetical protein